MWKRFHTLRARSSSCQFVDPEIPEAPVPDGPLHAPDEVESIVVQAERPVVVD